MHFLLLGALSLIAVTGRGAVEPAISSTFAEYESVELEEIQYVTLEPVERSQPLNPAELLKSTASVSDAISSIMHPEGASEADAVESIGRSAGFQIPGGGRAVTKGSFTAWTVPEDPAPREDYLIVIQIRLPKRIRSYRKEDLSGFLEGDDGYETPLGQYTGRGFPKKFYGRFDSKARQFVIRIPGGAARVRDTIRIRSKVLREDQRLEITF